MRMLGIAAGLLVVGGLAVGGAAQTQTQTLKGHLVDVMCASKHATESDFIAKHDKQCLLMEGCVKSGVSSQPMERYSSSTRRAPSRP